MALGKKEPDRGTLSERDQIRAAIFGLGYDEQQADRVMAHYDREVERQYRGRHGADQPTAEMEAQAGPVSAPAPVSRPTPIPNPNRPHREFFPLRFLGHGPGIRPNQKPIPNPNRNPPLGKRYWGR